MKTSSNQKNAVRRFFCDNAAKEISVALNTAKATTKRSPEENRDIDAVIHSITQLFDAVTTEYSDSDWEREKSLTRTIVQGAKSGSIEFRSREDFDNFYLLLASYSPTSHHEIEHYIQTGEILDLMGAVKGEMSRAITFKELEIFSSRVMSVKVRRLYCYDMNHDISSTPLDIRLHFSGFYEDEGGSA